MTDDRDRKNDVFTQQSGNARSQQTHSQGIQRETAADKMRREFGITLPSEVCVLPSKGIVYPQDSTLHMKESLAIKAMTTRDEDILTTRAFIKKGTVIDELLKSCITESDIDVEQLISGDRNALMVAIRCTGYGSVYRPTMKCPAGDHESEQSFDLSKQPIKPLGADPIAPGVNEFNYTLPKTSAKVTFKLLTGRDERELLATAEKRRKVLGAAVDSTISDQLKACLLSVNGVTDRAKLSFFVDHMPAEDSLALRTYVGDIQPGIDMTQTFECDKCGHTEGGVEIPISVEFLWPNRR